MACPETDWLDKAAAAQDRLIVALTRSFAMAQCPVCPKADMVGSGVKARGDSRRRDFDPPPARSSSHLREKLLEQSAQFERWALAAVRHHGRRDVCAPPARELSVASASRWR